MPKVSIGDFLQIVFGVEAPIRFEPDEECQNQINPEENIHRNVKHSVGCGWSLEENDIPIQAFMSEGRP